MGQLPDVIKLHEQFKDRDDFALVTVSYDRTHTIDRMHEVIEEYGITYPVLHQFVDDKPWAFGYEIRYIPKSVLIDPMGNIWGDFRINDELPEMLEFLLEQDEGYLPVITDNWEITITEGLEMNQLDLLDLDKNELYGVKFRFYSPTHLPVGFKIELFGITGNGNEYPLPVLYSSLSPTSPILPLPDYDEFGYSMPQLRLPKMYDAVSIRYSLEVVMPGSEHLNGGKGLVISETGSLPFDGEE